VTGITKSDRPPLFPKRYFPLVCPMFPGAAMCLNGVRAPLVPTLLTNRKDREGKETMGKKVTVLALFKAKPGLEEEVKRELMALQGPTRSEEGCINYDLHQSKEDPSRFMFYENWKSQEDLDKHLQMPYLKAFREKAGDLLAEPISITLHEVIGD